MYIVVKNALHFFTITILRKSETLFRFCNSFIKHKVLAVLWKQHLNVFQNFTILWDLLINAPSIYTFYWTNFLLLTSSDRTLRIDNYVVNMKAIRVVENLQLLFLYQNPGKPCTVVLNRRTCCLIFPFHAKYPTHIH